ncbi:hypothetical protein UA32_04765 [Photobacterium angustum]|uniref:Uncharacterized protein n=1 Tax=Photobacterium angustum TaxID=661 RepID=A0ABX5H3Q9_PHOAN|nr:hypothetical protein [Photobacterium angustum]KJG39644.1 hypothetical protein UA32_04765 [Photobacterium angustum]PSX10380.1 hypothetical protein C0W27_10115 [Photobacterium angustum]
MKGWIFKKDYLINEQGIKLTPKQILTGYALLEIGAEIDLKTKNKIIKIAGTLLNLQKPCRK